MSRLPLWAHLMYRDGGHVVAQGVTVVEVLIASSHSSPRLGAQRPG